MPTKKEVPKAKQEVPPGEFKLGRVVNEVRFRGDTVVLNDQIAKAMLGSLRAHIESIGLTPEAWVELGDPWMEWSAEESFRPDELIWKTSDVWRRLRMPRGRRPK